MNKVSNIFNKTLSAKPIIWFFVLLIIVLIGVISKYNIGAINNYYIYTGVFNHFADQTTLYGFYPDEYFDMNHYGIFFSFIIAPFAILPNFLGLLLWMVAGISILFYSIQKLEIETKYKNLISLVILAELFLSVAYQQFSIAMLGMTILSFHFTLKGRNSLATLLIVLGAFVKIYPLAALAFFIFAKRKWNYIGWFALWTVVIFTLPMLFSSPEYVINQYQDWYEAILSKNESNIFSAYQNISFLGVVRKISNSATYSDIWIMGSALILYLLPFLRVSQYRNYNFKLAFLSSTLLFITLFSTGSESCSYLIAMVGVGLWWAITPSGHSKLATTLFVLCILSTVAINILPPNFHDTVFRAYALKAIPFTLVWLYSILEMLKCDYYTSSRLNI